MYVYMYVYFALASPPQNLVFPCMQLPWSRFCIVVHVLCVPLFLCEPELVVLLYCIVGIFERESLHESKIFLRHLHGWSSGIAVLNTSTYMYMHVQMLCHLSFARTNTSTNILKFLPWNFPLCDVTFNVLLLSSGVTGGWFAVYPSLLVGCSVARRLAKPIISTGWGRSCRRCVSMKLSTRSLLSALQSLLCRLQLQRLLVRVAVTCINYILVCHSIINTMYAALSSQPLGLFKPTWMSVSLGQWLIMHVYCTCTCTCTYIVPVWIHTV